MDIRATEDNSDILRRVAGRDGRITTEQEWQRLDAADGMADGAFRLAGLDEGERVALAEARAGSAPVSVDFADNGRNDLAWDNPAIHEAYGQFLQHRWESWKANREEADCKTLVVRMMADFRSAYARQTGIQLPDPLPESMQARWMSFDARNRGGLANGIPAHAREDYAEHRQADGSGPELLAGRNHYLHGNGISAHTVARAATHAVTERDGQPTISATAQAMTLYPEGRTGEPVTVPAGSRIINQEALRPGDIIIQNHERGEGERQDATTDHFMQVLSVERDPESGKVRRLTIMMGTYDDLRDDDHHTHAAWGEINYYAEERTMECDDGGTIRDARLNWRSDAWMEEHRSQDQRIADAYNILGAWGEADFSVRAWGRTPVRR